MGLSKVISILIKFIWFITILLVITIDRNDFSMVSFTIILLLIISFITVVRSLNSRNEWRKIIEDGDVEIKDKIKFD
tara:strand:- start:313 stop:543 length:231 start_codon:yes stop_codon:yes gene_type:complete